MKNIIIILVSFILVGCEIGNVNTPCLIYGDTREIVDTVYLNDNGVHVDIVVPTGTNQNEEYTSFGWGAEQFFIYVPTWDEAQYKDFLNVIVDGDKVVIRETKYNRKRNSWIPVPVDQYQIDLLRENISNSYVYNDKGHRIKVNDPINNGTYYRATGAYSFFNTCNTWTNEMLKNSDLYAKKRAYFSEEIINLYK
tara:strand:+ start:1718 stop:2302 length:585 start_codon:yes stop_codon:yes gene_type:complete